MAGNFVFILENPRKPQLFDINSISNIWLKCNFIVTKQRQWKQPNSPMGEWIKMWYIHTKDDYSVLERKEILTPPTTQKDLEDTMLSEIGLKGQLPYEFTCKRFPE